MKEEQGSCEGGPARERVRSLIRRVAVLRLERRRLRRINECLARRVQELESDRDAAAGSHDRQVGGAMEAGGLVESLHRDLAREMSERRRVEEALSRSREDLLLALEEAQRTREAAISAGAAKDRFLAVLSHELRTPLTPVLIVAEGLLEEGGLPPPVAEALGVIIRNVQLEATLIDDLLDMTRVGRSTFAIEKKGVALHAVVRSALEMARAGFHHKAQRVKGSLEAENDHIEGDFRRLQQAFWNLLRNAAKFTPEGGEIRVRSRNSEDRWVEVTVTDTGIGIDRRALTAIFESFRQADETIGPRYGGLGLGLSITRGIVESHGGSVAAASPGPGKGATFTVRLPLAGTGAGRRPPGGRGRARS